MNTLIKSQRYTIKTELRRLLQKDTFVAEVQIFSAPPTHAWRERGRVFRGILRPFALQLVVVALPVDGISHDASRAHLINKMVCFVLRQCR